MLAVDGEATSCISCLCFLWQCSCTFHSSAPWSSNGFARKWATFPSRGSATCSSSSFFWWNYDKGGQGSAEEEGAWAFAASRVHCTYWRPWVCTTRLGAPALCLVSSCHWRFSHSLWLELHTGEHLPWCAHACLAHSSWATHELQVLHKLHKYSLQAHQTQSLHTLHPR